VAGQDGFAAWWEGCVEDGGEVVYEGLHAVVALPGDVAPAVTALVVDDDAQVLTQRADNRRPERDRAGPAMDEDDGRRGVGSVDFDVEMHAVG
jgi:hypothetical protein